MSKIVSKFALSISEENEINYLSYVLFYVETFRRGSY